ncbi:MAG: 50S ribosomal protein L9 [Thermodesulfobacteriota bacterium]
MEIIMKETIDTLGEVGDIVDVKPGYGRNYLIPQGKAVPATKGNRLIRDRNRAAIEAQKEEQRKSDNELTKKLAGTIIEIKKRVGPDEKLYGSVTAAEITAELKKKGIKIDKKKVILENPIKTIGEHVVSCKTGYQMNADIKIEVAPIES